MVVHTLQGKKSQMGSLIDQWTLFDFAAMRVQQVNNKKHFFTPIQTNMFKVNNYLTRQLLAKRILQAVHALQGKSRGWFSKFFEHGRLSINQPSLENRLHMLANCSLANWHVSRERQVTGCSNCLKVTSALKCQLLLFDETSKLDFPLECKMGQSCPLG